MMLRWLLIYFLCVASVESLAQGFRPLPFAGGVPGQVQMQALDIQRHQARTLLYREALEELKRNPQVADVRECQPGETGNELCLPPVIAGTPARATSGRRVALLIGNNRYLAPIPGLLTPARDVDRVAEILKQQFGFEVRIIKDANKADLVRSFARLAREAGSGDSILVYYAGHGYQMDDDGMGYWIPVDGSVKTAQQWVSNVDITKLLRAIPARQLLLISDSCFSGSLAREQAETSVSAEAQQERRAVLVLSSGGEEPVSDEGKGGHSIFAWHLKQSLTELGARTAGLKVYRVVRKGVSADYPQMPQYGSVSAAGHEAGSDFMFEPLR